MVTKKTQLCNYHVHFLDVDRFWYVFDYKNNAKTNSNVCRWCWLHNHKFAIWYKMQLGSSEAKGTFLRDLLLMLAAETRGLCHTVNMRKLSTHEEDIFDR